MTTVPSLVTLARAPLLEAAPPPTHDELDDVTPREPRAAYRWARAMGWDAASAGRLAAFEAGIPIFDGETPIEPAWTLAQVEALRFTRWRRATGDLT